jgi:hypothetical protein
VPSASTIASRTCGAEAAISAFSSSVAVAASAPPHSAVRFAMGLLLHLEHG